MVVPPPELGRLGAGSSELIERIGRSISFADGLADDLALCLMFRGQLQQAREVIASLESVLQPSYNAVLGGDGKLVLTVLGRRVVLLAEPSRRALKQQLFLSHHCLRCGEHGHRKRNCLFDEAVACSSCRGLGHLARACCEAPSEATLVHAVIRLVEPTMPVTELKSLFESDSRPARQPFLLLLALASERFSDPRIHDFFNNLRRTPWERYGILPRGGAQSTEYALHAIAASLDEAVRFARQTTTTAE